LGENIEQLQQEINNILEDNRFKDYPNL